MRESAYLYREIKLYSNDYKRVAQLDFRCDMKFIKLKAKTKNKQKRFTAIADNTIL